MGDPLENQSATLSLMLLCYEKHARPLKMTAAEQFFQRGAGMSWRKGTVLPDSPNLYQKCWHYSTAVAQAAFTLISGVS